MISLKKTKILCTIGPASSSREIIKKLIEIGADGFRLNFSHGANAQKSEVISAIREESRRLNRHVFIVADLSGPKLRLGEFDGEIAVDKGKSYVFGKKRGTAIPVDFDLSRYVKPGQRIFVNDGASAFLVQKITTEGVLCEALNSSVLTKRKGVNIPDTLIGKKAFTKKDKEDAQFALKVGVDYLALSFVQTIEHVREARRLVQKQNSNTKLIVKIEKPEALNILQELIENTDGVMVARGDLAVETSAAFVPVAQQKIIRLARKFQKPVIVATQMLESMIQNSTPTRAEASDVASAVLSQVDCVMLSGETAVGKYPVESVKQMDEIIREVEKNSEYVNYIRLNFKEMSGKDLKVNALVSTAASLSYRLSSPLIGVGTVSGKTASQLSSFRPSSAIVACCHSEEIARQVSLFWGVTGIVLAKKKSAEAFGVLMKNTLSKLSPVKKKDQLVLLWGDVVGVSGKTNRIRLVEV